VPAPAAEQPTFEPASLVGATLDGRYVLTSHLATGGMGAVFRAQHVHLRKDFAVKVLRPDLTSSPDLVERFRREAEIASALDHDNIVKVSDFGRSEEGSLFLVMELLTGESLFERLRREGFMSPEEAVPILWQVCAGLEAAHALGVVHRDLKPENVFLARTPSGREVTKILDFGIAKIADPPSGTETQAGIVVGTPEYLAPEQAMGAAVDGRADVYAVGLIAWRMLAGRHPFKADDARGLLMMQATKPVPPLTDPRPDLTAFPGLLAAVDRACAKEPLARQQSAGALRDELAAALGPAFMLPPGATPAPALSTISLSPSPGGPRMRTPDPRGPAPILPATPAEARAAVAPSRGLAAGARAAARETLAWARAHPRALGATAIATALLAVGIALVSWFQGRDALDARALLAGNRPAEARAVLDHALEHRPEDPELLLLRAHALHRVPGRGADSVEAYATARAHGPLDDAALENLVADLGRERSVADRAAKLLREEGARGLPAILRAAAIARGDHRLRALALARDLGAEDQIDRVQAYGALLTDPECETRRTAARRLGEIGDAAALPALRRAAQVKTEVKGIGLFAKPKQVPACGAPDAEAAAKRIEAARLPHP
jgi:eukaryotic-like serine/threonine-protein kinase